MHTAALAIVCASITYQSSSNVEAESITLEAPDGLTIYGEVYESHQPVATILLFHQGGSNSRGEYADYIIPRLVSEGFNIVTIDARAGGDLYGHKNRTLASLPEGADTRGYSSAYQDIIAAFEYAIENFNGPLFAWGSSYSGALVMKLAIDNPDEFTAVLGFSPASRAATMDNLATNKTIGNVPVPVLVAWPAGEWDRDPVKEARQKANNKGFEVYLQPQGVHGSSMLHPDRTEGGTEELWEKVLAFLHEHSTTD